MDKTTKQCIKFYRKHKNLKLAAADLDIPCVIPDKEAGIDELMGA